MVSANQTLHRKHLLRYWKELKVYWKVIKGLTSIAVDNYLDNKKKKKEHKEIVNSVVQQLSDKEAPSRSYIDEVINSGKGIVYD